MRTAKGSQVRKLRWASDHPFAMTVGWGEAGLHSRRRIGLVRKELGTLGGTGFPHRERRQPAGTQHSRKPQILLMLNAWIQRRWKAGEIPPHQRPDHNRRYPHTGVTTSITRIGYGSRDSASPAQSNLRRRRETTRPDRSRSTPCMCGHQDTPTHRRGIAGD